MSNKQYIQERIEELKKKLLDVTKGNSLISFKHKAGAKDHIRIIDENIDFIYSELIKDKTFEFKALPSDDEIPKDEQTEEFQLYYSDFKSKDEDYLKAISKLSEKEYSQEDYSSKLDEIEINLINKVREELGLSKRKRQGNDNKLIAEMHNLSPSFEMPKSDISSEKQDIKHSDKFIQVLLKTKEMNACLSGLFDRIDVDQKDSGINSCYIAIGFLRWFDADSSDQAIDSPLLLMPLNLIKNRTSKGPQYTISSTTDSIEVNLALKEKFKREFDIELPTFDEDETPETYLDKVQKDICKNKAKWDIKRFITVGRFFYSKAVMFKDLDSSEFSDNILLNKLFSGSEFSSDHNHSLYNIDEVESIKNIPELIYDADSSQMSSIIDALDGESMVIQGPPGTGKSQTIANLIAAAMERGKKVLFVAEKMAALEVVHNRLARKNLDSLCLELHSNKVGTPNVISSLSNRLNDEIDTYDMLINDEKHKETLSKLKTVKQSLNEYYFNMNNTYSAIKISLIDILGKKDYITKNLIKCDINESLIEAFNDSIIIENAIQLEDLEYRNVKDEICNLTTKFKKTDYYNQNIIGFSYKEKIPSEVVKTLRKIKLLSEHYSIIVSNLKGDFDDSSIDILALDDLSLIELKLKESLAISCNVDCRYIDKLKSKNDLWDDILKLASYHNRFMDSIRISDNLLVNLDSLENAFNQYNIKSIEDIKLKYDNLTSLHNLLIQESESIESILDAYQNPDATMKDLCKYLEFLNLLQDIDIKLLKLRSDAVLDFDNQSIFRKSSIKASEIKELESILSDQINIKSVIESSESILESIAYIKSNLVKNKINIISYIKHKNNVVRHAKVKYKDLSINILEKYLTLNTELENDLILKNVLTIDINRDINFNHYLKLNIWYKKVYDSFIGLNGVVKNIRTQAKTFDVEILRDLQQVFLDQDLSTILKMLNSSDIKVFDKDLTIKEFSQLLEQEIKAISGVMSAYKETIIDPSYSINELTNNKTAIQDYYGLYTDVLLSVKGELDISQMANTVNYIKLVSNLGLKSDKIDLLLTSNKETYLNLLLDNFKNIAQHKNNITDSLDELLRLKVISKKYIDSETVSHSNISLVNNKLKYLASDECCFDDHVSFNYGVSKLKESSAKLVINHVLDNQIALDHWKDLYDLAIMNSLLTNICKNNQNLTIHKGFELDQRKSDFKYLDKEIQGLQAKFIKNNILKNTSKCFVSGISTGPKGSRTESSLVNDIVKQKRPRIKVRDLMTRSSKTILNLKPCFMMSPLSVAQYLPRDIEFDLLIIDEASQMRVEDSIGAVIRSKQIIIVGDDKQLPPTSFFSGNTTVEDEDEIEEESILDLAKGKFNKSALLRWHYRSEHDSLIAYSNHKFYNGKLIAAPSPHSQNNVAGGMGLVIKDVNGTYANNKNLDEIKSITFDVREHIYNNPKQSLGVVAINKLQAEALRDHIETTLQTDIKYIEFCDYWQLRGEPLFFKNLENVQGDERDVIFISTVYGKEKDQSAVLQRFGPINSRGGERRLNVLFTRSKKRMVIFTSLKPEDIKSESNGAQALKGFLEYATTGRIDQGILTGKDADSDFEISVMDRLKNSGFIVEPQVGVSGFRIDLGVKHEKHPYGFLCGVECDGATYHSSRSARDRDILRQSVLESKEWKIFRVWSTDWFYSPDKAFAKLEKEILEHLDDEILNLSNRKNSIIKNEYEDFYNPKASDIEVSLDIQTN